MRENVKRDLDGHFNYSNSKKLKARVLNPLKLICQNLIHLSLAQNLIGFSHTTVYIHTHNIRTCSNARVKTLRLT